MKEKQNAQQSNSRNPQYINIIHQPSNEKSDQTPQNDNKQGRGEHPYQNGALARVNNFRADNFRVDNSSNKTDNSTMSPGMRFLYQHQKDSAFMRAMLHDDQQYTNPPEGLHL